MMLVIGIVVGISALLLGIGLISPRMAYFPRWHKFWLTIVGIGLVFESVEYMQVNSNESAWEHIIREVGICGLIFYFAFKGGLRFLKNQHLKSSDNYIRKPTTAKALPYNPTCLEDVRDFLGDIATIEAAGNEVRIISGQSVYNMKEGQVIVRTDAGELFVQDYELFTKSFQPKE